MSAGRERCYSTRRVWNSLPRFSDACTPGLLLSLLIHLSRPTPRLQTIVADAQATVALTTTQILSNGSRRFAHAPDLEAMRWLTTDSVAGGLEDSWQETAVTSDTLAFLQY